VYVVCVRVCVLVKRSVCVYVCVCVCMCECAYIHVYHLNSWTRVTDICIIHVCIHTYIHTHTDAIKRGYYQQHSQLEGVTGGFSTHIHMYTCIHIRAHTHTQVPFKGELIRSTMHIRTCVYMYTYTHIHTHRCP
jgi:hypothetical protein